MRGELLMEWARAYSSAAGSFLAAPIEGIALVDG